MHMSTLGRWNAAIETSSLKICDNVKLLKYGFIIENTYLLNIDNVAHRK